MKIPRSNILMAQLPAGDLNTFPRLLFREYKWRKANSSSKTGPPTFSSKSRKIYFLAIFWNENTTILTPSISEERGGGDHVVPNYKSAILIYLYNIICIRTHDTSSSFEPIFMKAKWLWRVYPQVSILFLETIGPIESLICGGGGMTQNQFFELKSDGIGFLRKKLKRPYSAPHFPQKRTYSFLSSNAPFPKK